MKQRAHFIRLYKRLELTDSASFEMLRLNYRRLATLYHPDKSNDPNPQQFQEIQAAYHELKKFYAKYGRMPLMGTEKISKPEISTTRSSSVSRNLRLNLSSVLYGLMTLILLVLLFMPAQKVQQTDQPSGESAEESVNSERMPNSLPLEDNSPSSTTTKLPPVEIGMRMGKIFEILGVPDDSVGDHWYYGNSTIFFREGRVIGWHLAPHSTIRIDESLPRIITPPARTH